MTLSREGVLFRRLLPEDAGAAANVERACFSAPWSERVYHETLLLPYSYYYGAFRENELVGTAGLQIIAGEGEISNVAVLSNERRRGIAGSLIRLALSEARELGVSDFTLEVRECGKEIRQRFPCMRALAFRSKAAAGTITRIQRKTR